VLNLRTSLLTDSTLILKIQLMNSRKFNPDFKTRVISHHYKEEFYLLGFLSGLKKEVVDAIILYNLTTLKKTYKYARQIEKSLNSQICMLKPTVKALSYSSNSSQTKLFNLVDDKISTNPPSPSSHTKK
jgi:hypothetical protein